MPFEQDSAADDLGKASAALGNAQRMAADWVELWRAFSDLHARELARIGDRRIAENEDAFPHEPVAEQDSPDPIRPGMSAADPVVFHTLVNSMIASTGVHFGVRLQELLSERMPLIIRQIDKYRADPDPPPRLYWDAIDSVRGLLHELGDFAVRQADDFRSRLIGLENDILPKHELREVLEDFVRRVRTRPGPPPPEPERQ